MPHVDVLLKRLEEANRRAVDQQHALNVSAILAMTDQRGVITYVNDQFCNISGYSSEELLGQTHRLINSGVHDSAFFEAMWKTISSGEVWKGEICNRAKDGSLYWVDTTIVPFSKEGESPYQYVAIRQDISSRKETEEKLRIERERLFINEKMASLGMLSTGISHELGNPLGALRGRIEMLETKASKGDAVDANIVLDSTQKMIDLVDRMAKIIRGLRSYSRNGSDDPKGLVDMAQLLTDILEISKERFQKHSVDVSIGKLDSKLIALGREAEMAQVIVNLINNAVDAAKAEENGLVKMSLVRENNEIAFEICNNGDTIPENVIPKIFDPFFTTKPVGEGTGLGLSICRSIVKNHNGDLVVTSENNWTCFKAIFPEA